jgi:glycosyltransferase involved in cell wall biosynthesis
VVDVQVDGRESIVPYFRFPFQGQVRPLYGMAGLVEPRNRKALAAAVVDPLRASERGPQMAVAARGDAVSRHGWERRARQLLDALELSRRRST